MREKFELASKIIGLVFFGLGLIILLCPILLFVLKPDVTQMLPESSRALYSQSQIDELRATASYTLNRYIIILVIVSIFELALGLYLMKSNNLFVKLCYPFENKNTPVIPPPDIQLDIKAKESQGESKEPSENKYAPPGYFQREK